MAVPFTPTGFTLIRSTDTTHFLSWSNNFTADRLIDKFRIQRHDGLRNPNWRTVTVVNGSIRAWTDDTTQQNTRYQWRIRAENSDGVTSWVYSAYISTRPPGAVTPTVSHKGGDNLVTVTRGGTNFNVRSIIQHQSAAAGGSWSSWATVHTTTAIAPIGASVTFRHVDVDPTRRHRYRNRLENVTDSPTFQGNWSNESAVIELLAPPNAPSSVNPNGVTIDAGKDWPVSWVHNPVDSTEQTRREVRTRVNGGDWLVAGLDTSDMFVVLGTDRLQGGASTEIQVRTWGDHPDPSPWSAISTFYSSELPQATITSPGEDEVLDRSSVRAEWSYFDAEGTKQSQWQATLYDSFSNPLEFRSGSGASTSTSFREQLEDAKDYRIGVSVRDGDRMWSEETITEFSTDFALPPAPVFTATFDPDSGVVVLDIKAIPKNSVQVSAEYIQIWRGIGSDAEVLIGDGIDKSSSFTDYLPHLVLPNYYRVVSVSALPSVASSPVVPVQVEERQRQGWVYFNGGTGFERVVRVRANADVQVTQGREKALRTFVGRKRPVEFSGEHETWEGSLSIKLAPSEPGHATRNDFADIVQLPAPICYRDVTAPTGNRVFVSLGDFDHSQRGVVSDGSLSFTRVEDPEIRHTNAALATGQLPGAGDGSGEDE